MWNLMMIAKNESNGTITATVLADSNPTPTYILASTDTSADVTVKDNDSEGTSSFDFI